MSITKRMGGYSVSCDNCEEGGFYGSHNLKAVLGHFELSEIDDKHLCVKCEALNARI